MPDIVIRPMGSEDRDDYFESISVTYNDGEPVPEERRDLKWHRAFVARQDDRILGSFSIVDLTCTRGQGLMKCGGVAAVSVLPHERRSGVGKEMMRWWIRRSRSERIPLASLYGFSEKYYRQFGYEVCGKRIRVQCPSNKIPRTKSDLEVRKLAPQDWQLLDPCFRQFASVRSGVSMRDEKLWQRVLAEHRPLTIYAAGDPVQAYVAVSHKTEFWSTDHVSEIAWSTHEGYGAILEVLRGIGTNKTALTWFEPSDSPFLAAHADTSVEFAISRPIMFRVCDVAAAIGALPATPFDRFTIRVIDDLIPENEGPWAIELRDGLVTASPAADADIEIDIQHFAQVLLGEPSLADLLRIGMVQVNRPEAICSALALLPPSPVYCPEFF